MPIDSCSLDGQPLLSLDQALHRIHEAIIPIKTPERIIIKAALGRILAEDIISPINLPRERNSAMDGYAFSSKDLADGMPVTLLQIGTSWAGKPFNAAIKPGECVRIFTGAVMPEGADSVVLQERVSLNEHFINLPASTKAKQNVREAGEDVRNGATLLPAGTKLNAAAIGLLAAAGIYEVSVIRTLKIAYFSTGDELIAIGQTLASGQLYDSNRYTLQALLTEPSFSGTDLGVVADDPEQLKNLLSSSADLYDVIISTGGASVGEADYIQQVLAQCGEVNFWKIAIKPGKPLAFGKIGPSFFFGLPGNPAAVITTFQQVVITALQRLCGMQPTRPWRFKATCLQHLNKGSGRLEFQRGILEQTETGDFAVRPAGPQGSHLLSAFSQANCYILLDIDCRGVVAGEQVIVEPF